MRRFVNADIVSGEITNAITLNRYAYANGNPVSNIDPFGLSADRGQLGVYLSSDVYEHYLQYAPDVCPILERTYNFLVYHFNVNKNGEYAIIKGARSKAAINQGINGTRYALKNADEYANVFVFIDTKTAIKYTFKLTNPSGSINWGGVATYAGIAFDTGLGIYENIQNGTSTQRIVSDAIVDIGVGAGTVAATTAIGTAIGSVAPVAGNVVGAAVGFAAGVTIDFIINADFLGGKSIVDHTKDFTGWIADSIVSIF